MKVDTHPTYYPEATITCACGASYSIGSTVKEMHVEICAACHPFYTGQDKIMDTAGRVEKFRSRAAKAQAIVVPKAAKKQTKKAVAK
jgi:large subunit ribosomal protein L31